MRRVTARGIVLALVGGLLSPIPLAAVSAPSAVATTPASVSADGADTTATVLTDTTPPPGPLYPRVDATATTLTVRWQNPVDSDFHHAVVRMTTGSTPPATPDDGTLLLTNNWVGYESVEIPNPVPGVDYGVSIFTVDMAGNYTGWSGVAHLDLDPPAQVTNLRITPYYQSVTVTLTPPTDADYNNFLYAISPGSDVPSRQSASWTTGTAFIRNGLSMGTDYTLAVWSQDRNWNVSDPVVAHFTTLLDTEPPHPVAGLAVNGGAYQVAASWTPPTDPDLQKMTATLTDDASGTDSIRDLPKTATGYTWRLPGGRSFTVRVTATDVNGLVSDVVTGGAQTDPDANGAPPPLAPSAVTLRPTDSSVTATFPRPAIPDLAGLAYAVVPVGQDPQSVTIFEPLEITSAIISRQLMASPLFTLQGGQLVLRVTDLNGNSTLSVVPGLRAPQQYLKVPPVPSAITVTSPGDNTLGVGWTSSAANDPASWTITAVSGAYSEIMTVPGRNRQVRLPGLAGQRNWTVGVAANNDFGTSGGRTADPVLVAGAEPPPPVTGVRRLAAYDTEVLMWTNPASADFDHVEVTLLGGTPAESRLVYRGAANIARVSGLAPGRAYSFEIRTFDSLGRAAGIPVTVTSTQSSATLVSGLLGSARPGDGVPMSGQVTWNGGAIRGGSVNIQALPAGASIWQTVTTGITWPHYDSYAGTFNVWVNPTTTTRYRAAYHGSAQVGGSYSPVITVLVSPPAAASAKGIVHARQWLARAW